MAVGIYFLAGRIGASGGYCAGCGACHAPFGVCRNGYCGKSVAFFENIGTVQDGIGKRSRSRSWCRMLGDAKKLVVTRGEIAFDHACF